MKKIRYALLECQEVMKFLKRAHALFMYFKHFQEKYNKFFYSSHAAYTIEIMCVVFNIHKYSDTKR